MEATAPSSAANGPQVAHNGCRELELPSASSSASAARWFLILLGVHWLVWTVVPVLTQPNAPLDAVEMVYWGNEWQWGYHKHPPLPAWIAASVTSIFGGSLWPLYAVSQVFIVGSFWVCWRVARAVIEPWAAVAAVAVLEFCLFYNFVSPEFNNNIPPKLFWALTVALLFFALEHDFAVKRAAHPGRKRRVIGDWKSVALWSGTGASIALSLLSKYDVAILIFSLLAFAILHPRGRAAWKTSGPWICTLVALVMFLPHAIWVWQSDFVTLQYFKHRSESAANWLHHVTNPLEFIGSQALALVGVLVALAILFRWRLTLRDLTDVQRFARSYLTFAVLGPLLVVVALSLISGGKMKSSWGASMWTFLPLLLMLTFKFHATPRAHRRLVHTAIAATVVLGVGLAVRNVAGPHLRNKPSRVHFPGAELAATVQRAWSDQNREPLRTVGGNAWYAGNAAIYATSDVSVYSNLTPEHAPWSNDEQLSRFGGVILWPVTDQQDASEMPEPWRKRFPRARTSRPIVLDWQTSARLEPLRVGIAIVDPASTQRFASDPGLPIDQSERQRR